MATLVDQTSKTVPETLERELRLIREAIALVASGSSARVVVASLRFGNALLEPARLMAAPQGVRVVPLWTIEDASRGLAFEAVGND